MGLPQALLLTQMPSALRSAGRGPLGSTGVKLSLFTLPLTQEQLLNQAGQKNTKTQTPAPSGVGHLGPPSGPKPDPQSLFIPWQMINQKVGELAPVLILQRLCPCQQP